MKGKVEQLTAEKDKALSESVIVRQQRNCHADHAQLLVKENKRLMAQLQSLKVQQAHLQSAEQANAEKGAQKCETGMKTRPKLAAVSQNQGASGDERVARGSSKKKRFDGIDVQNSLHTKPFDLSKGSTQQGNKSSKAILMQAQHILAAARHLQ